MIVTLRLGRYPINRHVRTVDDVDALLSQTVTARALAIGGWFPHDAPERIAACDVTIEDLFAARAALQQAELEIAWLRGVWQLSAPGGAVPEWAQVSRRVS